METTTDGGNTTSVKIVPLQDVLVSDTDKLETPTQIIEPAKTEPAPETKPEGETAPEAKAEGDKPADSKVDSAANPTTDAPVFQLSDDLIKDAPQTYQEDTFQKLADDLGFTIPEESFEAFQKTFKENYIPKAEAEKQFELSKDKVYEQFDPKLATAFKMIDLGVPQELALNPTKIQDDFLAMEDAQLARQKLLATGYDEDGADLEMENLTSNPGRLATFAKNIRVDLTNQKNAILSEQQQIYQDYVTRNEQKSIRAKEESDAMFKKALTGESTFMGAPLSDSIKEKILGKYNRGLYENVQNDPRNKVLAILYSEFGEEIAKALQSRAKAEGEAKIVQKLANIPETKSVGGSRVETLPDTETSKSVGFGNMPSPYDMVKT